MSDEAVLVERKGRVGVLTINRPKALNALNSAVLSEMLEKAAALDADKDIGCIVITGNERAFAAGADIKEMSEKTYMDMYYTDHFGGWDKLGKMRTPKIAAVNGFALGGGCELAMICDFIIAGDGAKFGQPEINLGVIPGAGGTQRLTRFVGKSKAMEMCLTGRMMDAEEAERCGLVSRIVAADKLIDDAIATATKIADKSLPSVLIAKECVNRSYETTLSEGVRFERRVFHSLFAFDDQTEGMTAFIEKRDPKFKGK